MIRKVETEATITKVKRLIKDLVDRPNHLSLNWLNNHRWAAVPVPDAINDMDAEWISLAAQEVGCNVCLAVCTELELVDMTLEEYDALGYYNALAYWIDMTQEDLVTFSRQASLLNYVIIPENRSFAIMKESGYYFLIAGAKEFVRKSVGGSLRTARRMFNQYANQAFLADQAFLKAVAQRYEPFNGDVIKKIEVEAVIAKAKWLIADLVERSGNLSLKWLREHGWAAAPVPEYISDMDAEWISFAAQEVGCNVCLAIELEKETVYEIEMTQDNLLEFDSKISTSDYIIVPTNRYFILMRVRGSHFIIAGPKQFVRKSIGCSFQTVRKMFEIYADDSEPHERKELLREVAQRYEPFCRD